jgi:hypothetical protein
MICFSSFARSNGMVGTTTRLQRRERGDGHLQCVRPAQQHPVARLQTHFVDQHVSAAIDEREQFAIGGGARRAVHLGPDRRTVAMTRFDGPLEQLGRAVQARRIGDVRVVEQKDGPLVLRRKIVARESIDVC